MTISIRISETVVRHFWTINSVTEY